MRPRKVVLLVDADPERRSVTRYVLKVHGYQVASVPFEDRSEQLAAGVEPDCILGMWPMDCKRALLMARKFCAPFMLIAAEKAEVPVEHQPHVRLDADTTPAELLEALRKASYQGRGPVSYAVKADSARAALLLGVA